MKFRRLGRTGLMVSEIGLGAVELGMEYGIPSPGAPRMPGEKDAERILNRSLDLGINFIDTARAYGKSEEVIGRALRGRRREFILASKVQCQDGQQTRGTTLQKDLDASVGASLKALGTDVIDLLQLHSASVEVIRRGEAAQVLKGFQKAGKIRFIGATVYGEAAALEAVQAGVYDCIQIAYNALDREPEPRILPAAQQNNIGVVVRSVLLKGALTYRHTSLPEELAELKSAVVRMESFAASRSIRLPELAYRFVLRQSAVSTALAGVSSIEELEAAAEFSNGEMLSTDLTAEIEAIDLRQRELLNPGNWPVQ